MPTVDEALSEGLVGQDADLTGGWNDEIVTLEEATEIMYDSYVRGIMGKVSTTYAADALNATLRQIAPGGMKVYNWIGDQPHPLNWGYSKPRLYPASFGFLLVHNVKYPVSAENGYRVVLAAIHLDLTARPRKVKMVEEWALEDVGPYDTHDTP